MHFRLFISLFNRINELTVYRSANKLLSYQLTFSPFLRPYDPGFRPWNGPPTTNSTPLLGPFASSESLGILNCRQDSDSLNQAQAIMKSMTATAATIATSQLDRQNRASGNPVPTPTRSDAISPASIPTSPGSSLSRATPMRASLRRHDHRRLLPAGLREPPAVRRMCASSHGREAQAAGFRPCKRCRPIGHASGPLDKIRAHIETHLDRPVPLKSWAGSRG